MKTDKDVKKEEDNEKKEEKPNIVKEKEIIQQQGAAPGRVIFMQNSNGKVMVTSQFAGDPPEKLATLATVMFQQATGNKGPFSDLEKRDYV